MVEAKRRLEGAVGCEACVQWLWQRQRRAAKEGEEEVEPGERSDAPDTVDY
jgi:hypothetical protein